MRKNIISAAILLFTTIAAVSCAKEIQSPDPVAQGVPATFTGVIEQFGGSTKTSLNSSHAVEWDSTDSLRINDGIFTVAPKSDRTTATFTFNGNGTSPESGPYTAYYPASLYDGTKAVLPAVQKYAAGKIANSPMYATSTTQSLHFHNICGLVEFTLKGTAKVRKIIVTAAEGGLSGEFTVDGSNAAVLTDAAKAANAGVTLDCGTGGAQLDSDGVKFWIAIPAGTYTLSFTMFDTDGNAYQLFTKQGVAVAANVIYAFDKTPSFNEVDYLCFTAREDGVTVRLNKHGSPVTNALEYSTDLVYWTDIVLPDGADTHVDITTMESEGDKVFVRAKTARTVAQNFSNYIYFSTEGDFDLSGNIMYLLDPTGKSRTISTDNAFEFLFHSCHGLLNAGKLQLPATTLSKCCYECMFNDCGYLTEAPAILPATTLTDDCYSTMFDGCSSLTTAPELPAMTLAARCYYDMFGSCDALTTAPELPALKLAPHCYNTMFYRCESLTTAPILPAEKLEAGCYNFMFEGCINLSSITCLATEITGSDYIGNKWEATKSWVAGVSSTGTFTKAEGADWSVKTGNDGIPSGWTVVETAVEHDETLPDGALSGKFTVSSAGKAVHFSKGNLQATFDGSAYSWAFAASQHDFVGNAAGNTTIGSQTAGAKVDLFGWVGTSGTGDAYGISTDKTMEGWWNFPYYGTEDSDVLKADWGVAYCESNGVTPATTWRTLTIEEWDYLARKSKNGNATVCGVAGTIILPDEFTDPMKNNGSGEFVPKATGFDQNVYASGTDWDAMEAAGAVFLPAAGSRDGSGVSGVGTKGYYWSSTVYNALRIRSGYSCGIDFPDRFIGSSVRLVTDAN